MPALTADQLSGDLNHLLVTANVALKHGPQQVHGCLSQGPDDNFTPGGQLLYIFSGKENDDALLAVKLVVAGEEIVAIVGPFLPEDLGLLIAHIHLQENVEVGQLQDAIRLRIAEVGGKEVVFIAGWIQAADAEYLKSQVIEPALVVQDSVRSAP